MTDANSVTLRSVAPPSRPSAASNALVFGWRAILKFKHMPEQLFDLVMSPVMLTLLFTFIFGGALAGSTENYLQYFLPGVLVQTVMMNSLYSGMALNTDFSKGLFDRFKTLPIWSLAPFAGLMVGDLLRHLIACVIVLVIGLLLGYRPETGIAGVLPAFALLLAIGVGAGYLFMVVGLMVRTTATVMTISYGMLFPLTFASNIMVRPETMPPALRYVVELNPVSLMATAIRGLMAGTVTGEQIVYALIVPVVLTLTLSPVVLWLSRRK
jgi:ABC-2 type transport system permease protein